MMNLLVPTDFSHEAEQGIDFAFQLGYMEKSKIFLWHILDNDSRSLLRSGDGEEKEKKVELIKGEESKIKALEKYYKNSKAQVETKLFSFEKKDNIEIFAKAYDIDFIIIGVRDNKKISGFINLAKSQEEQKFGDYGFVFVPTQIPNFKPDNIVLALDVDNEIYDGIKKVKDFAGLYNSKIHLLYVNQNGISSDEAISKLNSLAQEFKLDNITINSTTNNSIEMGIHNYVKRNDVDMVALLTRDNSGLSSIFHESTTENVLLESNVPVFVYNAGKK